MPPLKAIAAEAVRVDAGIEDASSSEAAPSLEMLASRGLTDMSLMQEVVRSSDAIKPTVVSAGQADTCFRAAVGASAPVRARFEDASGVARGSELSGASGLVPPRGPACARRGETLRLVVEPVSPDASVTARAVVWQAP